MFSSLSAKMKEFDPLQQTNQVIQKEMTKWSQNIINLENQKKAYEKREEAYLKDLESLREKEAMLMEKLDSLESENCSRITTTPLTASNDEHASRLAELTNELAAKESTTQSLIADYDLRLNEANERNRSLHDSLRTQEALTKQLEIQLENQVKAVKQKDAEINGAKSENQSAQEKLNNLTSKLKEMEEVRSKYEENLSKEASSKAVLNDIQEKNKELTATIENLQNANKT